MRATHFSRAGTGGKRQEARHAGQGAGGGGSSRTDGAVCGFTLLGGEDGATGLDVRPRRAHMHTGRWGGGWRHAEPPATDLILQMKDRREPMHMRMDDCCPSFFTVPVFRSRMRPRGEDATSEGRGHGHQPLPWWGHGHREPPTPRMPCGWAGHKGVCQQPPMQHQTPHSRQNCTRGHRGLRRLPAPVAHALPVLLPSALGRLRSSPLPLQLCAPVTSAGQRPHAHASGTSPSATATLKGGHALPGPSRSLVSPTP